MADLDMLLHDYTVSVRFPDVSGFEILEMLDTRSAIAAEEGGTDPEQVAQLEEADAIFLENAPRFYLRILELGGDMADLRRRARVTPSQWWWYLEKLCARQLAAA